MESRDITAKKLAKERLDVLLTHLLTLKIVSDNRLIVELRADDALAFDLKNNRYPHLTTAIMQLHAVIPEEINELFIVSGNAIAVKADAFNKKFGLPDGLTEKGQEAKADAERIIKEVKSQFSRPVSFKQHIDLATKKLNHASVKCVVSQLGFDVAKTEYRVQAKEVLSKIYIAFFSLMQSEDKKFTGGAASNVEDFLKEKNIFYLKDAIIRFQEIGVVDGNSPISYDKKNKTWKVNEGALQEFIGTNQAAIDAQLAEAKKIVIADQGRENAQLTSDYLLRLTKKNAFSVPDDFDLAINDFDLSLDYDEVSISYHQKESLKRFISLELSDLYKSLRIEDSPQKKYLVQKCFLKIFKKNIVEAWKKIPPKIKSDINNPAEEVLPAEIASLSQAMKANSEAFSNIKDDLRFSILPLLDSSDWGLVLVDGKFEETNFNRTLPHPTQIENSDALRNINSYEYLQNIAKIITPELALKSKVWRDIIRHCNKEIAYDQFYPYGDLYTSFMDEIESHALTYYGDKNAFKPVIDAIAKEVYLNENQALERTHATIKETLAKTNQTSKDVEHQVTKRLSQSSHTINETNPVKKESMGEKLNSVMGETYTPQRGTSQPSVRHYRHQDGKEGPTEIRMGTQGQRIKDEISTSNVFEGYLKATADSQDAHKITHVYFNGLANDHTGNDLSAKEKYERGKEREFTDALYSLEERQKNLAVITLPADKGLMSASIVNSTAKTLSGKNVFEKLKEMALGTLPRDQFPTQDFRISDAIKAKLFGKREEDEVYNKDEEGRIVDELLKKSFEALGFDEKSTLQDMSEADRQAVLFHFTKYEYTNFILEKLKPQTFNMSCKDGIDRAGVHSLYYNLMKSFEEGKEPLSREEFERGLHAPPALVKGRGMNAHTQRIWNVVNQYIEKNPTKFQDEKKQWLIEWRNSNVPKGRRFYDLARRSMNDIDRITDDLHDEKDLQQNKGFYKALKEGVAKYLRESSESNRGHLGFFAKRFQEDKGMQRAEFYIHLLSHSKDNAFGIDTIAYALIATNNGTKLKETVADALYDKGFKPQGYPSGGKASEKIESMRQYIKERLVQKLDNKAQLGNIGLDEYLKDIVGQSNDVKQEAEVKVPELHVNENSVTLKAQPMHVSELFTQRL